MSERKDEIIDEVLDELQDEYDAWIDRSEGSIPEGAARAAVTAIQVVAQQDTRELFDEVNDSAVNAKDGEG